MITIQNEGFRLRSLTQAECQTAASGDPVYNYQFAFVVNDVMKATHAMEIPFVFSNTGQSGMMSRLETKQVKAQMSEAWIAFAKTGNPNHPGIPEWPPYTVEKRSTMVFDAETRVVDDLQQEERLAWADIETNMSPVSI